MTNKFAILGDTHWGVRNDLPLFYQHFEMFYDEFIDYLLVENITTLFQLGDLFDRRKYINFKTLSKAKKIFFDRLAENNITLHVLVGNHDIHMRESVQINSPGLVLGEYDNVHVYSSPETVSVGETSIDLIPWICRENQQEVFNYIKASSSDLCFGHFEIDGFAMHQGIPSYGGLAHKLFEKYELVCSGHFHTRSKQGNITYVGTPYEMTWGDWNDPKGYHTFDLETRELLFIRNYNTAFHKVYYDDTKELPSLELKNVQDKFIKLYVLNKSSPSSFDKFCRDLNSMSPYDVKIIEDLAAYTEVELDGELNLEDTSSIIGDYVDTLELDFDKTELKQLMRELYTEAVNL